MGAAGKIAPFIDSERLESVLEHGKDERAQLVHAESSDLNAQMVSVAVHHQPGEPISFAVNQSERRLPGEQARAIGQRVVQSTFKKSPVDWLVGLAREQSHRDGGGGVVG